jgi:hypothetical protein
MVPTARSLCNWLKALLELEFQHQSTIRLLPLAATPPFAAVTLDVSLFSYFRVLQSYRRFSRYTCMTPAAQAHVAPAAMACSGRQRWRAVVRSWLCAVPLCHACGTS